MTRNSRMDRIDAPQVQREYWHLEAMAQELYRAESAMLEGIQHEPEMLKLAANWQAKYDRIHKAAVQQYSLMVWGRELEFIHA